MFFILLRQLQFWVLIGYATFLSLTPQPGKIFEQMSDKFLHTLCWFVLYLSLQCAFYKYKSILRSFTFLFVISTIIEFGQIVVPGRHFSWFDIVANTSGLLLAAFISIAFYRYVLGVRKPYIPELEES